MKRFIISSPAFNGEINVLYGIDNKLQFVDFMKCDLSEEQINFFKNKLPANFNGGNEQLQTFFVSDKGTVARLNITDEKYFISFEQFWNRYAVKRNPDRCLKLWNKLSQADQVAAYFKLGRYERYCQLNTWYNKALPETYLRNKYWNDDWGK
jgi:hypothetical protein